MKKLAIAAALPLFIFNTAQATKPQPPEDTFSCPLKSDTTLAIHAGVGVMDKSKMSDELEADYRRSLMDALVIGNDMLQSGSSALDVVEAVVVRLEDDPKFNAGKGAVFTDAGVNELDSSIMDGRDRNTGAVAGVKTIKNPIRLARKVMENSRHVMFQGEGAETFAAENGIETVDPSYFYTERRWQALQNMKAKKHGALTNPENRFGTVGAVVKDGCGNLAAGTSTGGMTGKKWGRVGDSPIIGAGTYADNRYCAVSATGTGEYFIRATIARDVCARQQFTDESLQASADVMIQDVLTEMGGDGGIVTLDDEGNYAFSFNTPGMFRGGVRHGQYEVAMFGDKE